jgi:hypothetical protein
MLAATDFGLRRWTSRSVPRSAGLTIMRQPYRGDVAGDVDGGDAAGTEDEPGSEHSRGVSDEDEIAIRAAELLDVHSYGPEEEYEPAVARLEAALARRRRESRWAGSEPESTSETPSDSPPSTNL